MWRNRGTIIWLLVCLIVLLAAALYLRSRAVETTPPADAGLINEEQAKEAPAPAPESPAPEQEPGTKPPDGTAPGKRADYYTEQRLERDRVRSQEMDTLREIVHNPNSDEGNRREAHTRLLFLSQQAAKEAEVEGLIKAKDFPDALVYLHQDSAHVLVKVPELTMQQAAQIGDIVATATGLSREKIIIDTRP
ncbi:MAG TPA: SpoIIIAH-like family protein [Firmicutes bacterium]|jgi:stage III sporulation protein AH|nr:stage sporulation protein [Bacillota bacterium]HHV56276.1 SpoIIIAH-like family protein [Bacillota bacterium]